MRKFYILLAAVATLALSAACSKVVMSADGPGEKAISFEVANYMPRTKANVAFDTGKTFTTYAWSFGTDSGDGFPFMTPATIGYNESAGVWKAINRPYYWPKTGSLSFISYFNPTDWAQPSVELGYNEREETNEIHVMYGQYAKTLEDQTVEDPIYVTIEEDDDALLADAAFRYYWKQNDWDEVTVDGSNPGFTGVPTLFHHLLSKVTIQVLFDASGAEDGYSWNLKVNQASFTCVNEGTLSVTFQDPMSTDHIWPFVDDPNDPENGVWWAPKVREGGYAVLVEKWNPESARPSGNDAGDNTVSPNEPAAGSDSPTEIAGEADYAPGVESEPIVLWDDISVLPQMLFSDQKFSFNITLTSTYNGGNPLVETVDLSGIPFWNPQVEPGPGGFSPVIDAWKMGHRYIYTITIKPNGAVKFDPAEVDWTVEEIDYPY